MITPKTQSDAWREALKIINRCPICGEHYQTEAARLFAKKEAASFVHITCQKCRGFFIAMILLLGQGLSSVGMITDMSYQDVERLYKTKPLTTDEVIAGFTAIESSEFVGHLLSK